MQQYQVPQFINIEDRIVGPLTLKQFTYLLGGGGVIIVSWFFLKFFLFILVATPAAVLSLAMAFFTVNGRPFTTVMINGINFYLKPRLYIWKRTAKKDQMFVRTTEPQNTQNLKVPSMTESKISDLSWGLDIKEKISR